MSKTKHTPGPWSVHQGQDYVEVVKEGKIDDRIISTIRYPGQDDIANAALIAAAPDLLAVVENLQYQIAMFPSFGLTPRIKEVFDALGEKATLALAKAYP